jgi:DHA1 family bicyclomycin/chloramphenicol resistance-like MFS transporter
MSVSSSTASVPSAMDPARVVVLLGLLLGLQPVTTDLYLPALPALQQHLGASMPQVQLTLTAMLLAFGCSQLVWGPLSDRFGRRPILLTGLCIYVVAALGSVATQSMEALIGWRALQGMAMGACVMCARAVVRDLFSPAAGAQAMSRALTGLGIIACISAPTGSLLSDWLGWRATMGALAAFGACALILVVLRFTESNTRPNLQALRPAQLARNWAQILRHPTFIAFTATITFSYAGLFTFLASSSFTLIQVLGWPKTAYGVMLAAVAAMYIAGTMLCRKLLPRWGVRKSVALAGGLSISGGTLMGLAALLDITSGWAYVLPFCLYQLAHGIHMPCGQSGSMGPFPQIAGTASALNGFSMMVAAFAVGHWLGISMDGTVMPMAMGVWALGTATALAAWILVGRYGEPA